MGHYEIYGYIGNELKFMIFFDKLLIETRILVFFFSFIGIPLKLIKKNPFCN